LCSRIEDEIGSWRCVGSTVVVEEGPLIRFRIGRLRNGRLRNGSL